MKNTLPLMMTDCNCVLSFALFRSLWLSLALVLSRSLPFSLSEHFIIISVNNLSTSVSTVLQNTPHIHVFTTLLLIFITITTFFSQWAITANTANTASITNTSVGEHRLCRQFSQLSRNLCPKSMVRLKVSLFAGYRE